MRTLWKVNQAGAAVMNRRLVVHLLREQGPLSRQQLAQRTGLRSSSLTYITRDLMDRGVIRTFGKLERPGAGKKQVLLEVDPGLGWVLGVGVEGDAAALVMLDCKGDVIDRDRILLREPFQFLPQVLKSRIENWSARRGAPPGKLLGVGVGMTGVIDPDAGVVLRSTRFKLENHPLAQRLSEAFGTPVRIDNDSNLAAFAEARQGNAADAANFLYFLVNSSEKGDRYAIDSLGSALFINGQVYRGAHYGAGEIDTLIEGDHFDAVTAEQLLALSAADGPFSDDLHPLANRMAQTLAAIADLLDPAVIILGGNLGLTNRRMIAHIQEQLHQHLVPLPKRHVAVRPSLFMDHGVSMGAAFAVLDEVLLASPADANRHALSAPGVQS